MTMIEIPTTFGPALKDARARKQLSQAQLGELVGVSGAQIGHYERGADAPTAARCFELEVQLDLAPGDLSRHLGFAPLDGPADTTDYNSRLARMPDHVRRAVDAIIDAEERALDERG